MWRICMRNDFINKLPDLRKELLKSGQKTNSELLSFVVAQAQQKAKDAGREMNDEDVLQSAQSTYSKNASYVSDAEHIQKEQDFLVSLFPLMSKSDIRRVMLSRPDRNKGKLIQAIKAYAAHNYLLLDMEDVVTIASSILDSPQ